MSPVNYLSKANENISTGRWNLVTDIMIKSRRKLLPPVIASKSVIHVSMYAHVDTLSKKPIQTKNTCRCIRMSCSLTPDVARKFRACFSYDLLRRYTTVDV